MFVRCWKQKTRPLGRVFAVTARQQGYTVVELVVVMVIMGILAANAMPAFFSSNRFEEMGFADSTASALRYARKVAVTSGCDTRVAISAAGFQMLQRAKACDSGTLTRAVVRPGGGTWSELAPAGVGIGSLDLFFDAAGTPYDYASTLALATPQSVSVGARSITVEPITGFVH